LTGEDCAVEQTLAVDPLAPLLAGDAAAAAWIESRYQHEFQRPSSSHLGNSVVTQMEWYSLGHFLHWWTSHPVDMHCALHLYSRSMVLRRPSNSSVSRPDVWKK
jgi:hypothetical protein